MRKSFAFILATLLALVFAAGCKEKPVTTPGDLEDPRIILTSPVEVGPENAIQILSSDSFYIDVRFEDDKELRDWEITIRFMPELDYLRTTSAAWKETWYGPLDGTVGGVNEKEFVIYDPTAGYYEFKVTVNDEAGKTAVKKTYFYVKNRLDLVAPTITFTMPDTNNIDTFAIGQAIHIIARAEEPGDVVRDGFMRIRDKLTKTLVEGSEMYWDTVYLSQLNVDTMFSVPAGTVPSNYQIEFYANDQLNNVNMGKCEIYIKPN
jgi:hypothetical protein